MSILIGIATGSKSVLVYFILVSVYQIRLSVLRHSRPLYQHTQ